MDAASNPLDTPIRLMRFRHRLQKHFVKIQKNDTESNDMIEELFKIEMLMYKDIKETPKA